MNLGTRSKFSLCQLLSQFERDELVLLLGKYGLSTDELQHGWVGASTAAAIRDTIVSAAPGPVGEMVQGVARTRHSMRAKVAPRYRFDERWQDLCRCLELDGYGLVGDEFAPIEPVIEGASTAEDDLTRELGHSGLPEVPEIERVLNSSADAFRSGDYNGCLTNARVALQTMATAIAKARCITHPGNFDANKWGQVASYLRTSGFIDRPEEDGLTGVFSFLSPGAHLPVGFTQEEFTRLGRSLAVSFCYFLAKRLNAGGSLSSNAVLARGE
jgi:hypothetical protein